MGLALNIPVSRSNAQTLGRRMPFLRLFLMLVTLTGALFANVRLSAATTKPNVLILVSDDQGWMDVGYHGGEPSTPNIDQLVKDGTELNRFYAYPICSPTRTSLLTGHISMRHGVFTPMPANMTLTHDEQLLNEAFKDAGYMTMTAGKWHLGMMSQRDLPINRGFDHTYGSLRAGPDYWTHGRGDQIDWGRDGKTVHEGGYVTDLFGNEISRLIRERDTSKPFFSYVAFTAPHTPLQAPQSFVDKYAHIEDMDRRVYCAMVEVLDVAIGNILQTIDDEGIRDNTIVLFFSDNGGSYGADNGEFRGRKGRVYEGGTRMPAVIRWPGKIPSNVKSDQQMVVYDVFPTLVDALGISTKLNTPFDGESVWDALQSGKARPRKTDMIIGNATAYAVHSGEYKLVHSNINETQGTDSELIELFKIYDDPNETTNVADKYPAVVKTLIGNSAFAADWVAKAPAQTNRRNRGGLRRYDTDGDGIINLRDIEDTDLDAFNSADTNQDKVVDAAEFAVVRAAGGGRGGRPSGPGGGRPSGGSGAAAEVDPNAPIVHIHESVPSI